MKTAALIMAIIGIAIGAAMPSRRPAATTTVKAQTTSVATAPEPAIAPVEAAVGGETLLDRASGGHFIAVADVNDEPVHFVVDTGADTVALTMDDARRAHIDFDPNQFVVIGKGAAGDVRGQEIRINDIVLDGKRATDVRGVVLDGADISLLGQTFLRRIDTVQIKGDQMSLR